MTPFNETWVTSVAITALGAGVLLAIAVALPIVWRTNQAEAELYFGTLVLLVVGAFVWGARLGDFTMFYVFFAGIAVIATPVAAIASRRVWVRLSASGHRIFALGLVLLCALQLEAGVANAGLRLQFFGGGAIDGTIPEALIDRIRHLPPDAKLAYSCEPLGESSFGVARLLSIDAHTRRPVVPMCFQAETLTRWSAPPRPPRYRTSISRWPRSGPCIRTRRRHRTRSR